MIYKVQLMSDDLFNKVMRGYAFVMGLVEG